MTREQLQTQPQSGIALNPNAVSAAQEVTEAARAAEQPGRPWGSCESVLALGCPSATAARTGQHRWRPWEHGQLGSVIAPMPSGVAAAAAAAAFNRQGWLFSGQDSLAEAGPS